MDRVELDSATIARIEAKLDALKEAVDRTEVRMETSIADHETRIRKVEGWRARVIGLAAATGFFFAFIKDALTNLINPH